MPLWLGSICALCVLCVAESGWANEAPMCDDDAASVAAPLPAPPSDDGTIDVPPCGQLPFILILDRDESDPTPREPSTQFEVRSDLGWIADPWVLGTPTPRRSLRMAGFGVPSEGVRSTIDKPPRC